MNNDDKSKVIKIFPNTYNGIVVKPVLSNGKTVIVDEVIKKMEKILIEQPYAVLRSFCFYGYYKVGDEKQYISQVIELEKMPNQRDAIIIAAPTGSGKTAAIRKIINDYAVDIVYLTNRKATLLQFKRDLIKENNGIDVPEEMLDIVSLGDNITACTYQKFANEAYKYKGKKLLLILDEFHCMLEDATFSVYTEKILRYLRANVDNTSRIYLTATPDAVTSVITDIESLFGRYKEITPETKLEDALKAYYGSNSTRVKAVYSVRSDWSYLDFKFYSPNDTKELLDYIRKANEEGTKSLIYINDINKGKKIQEVLGGQHIYSDEDKRLEIAEIAMNEKFSDRNLITTKVAENGVSLHDEELGLIVVETLDLITLQQVIGRARVNRKNPRKIEVLIPDYTDTDIGNAIASISQQLKKAKEVAADPDKAMEYVAEHPALVYYDSTVKKPVVNTLAIKSLEYLLDLLKRLKAEQEISHPFVRKVLETYGKSTDISDDMFLSYDRISDFKSKVKAAFDDYIESDMNGEALDMLKSSLKDACNATKMYNNGKPLNSNIQLSTVNDILSEAGIAYEVKPKNEFYDIGAI